MISKKRYLELKRQRKQLHIACNVFKARFKRKKRQMDTISRSAFREEFALAQKAYNKLREKYRLVDELIKEAKARKKMEPIYLNHLLRQHIEDHMKALDKEIAQQEHEQHMKFYNSYKNEIMK